MATKNISLPIIHIGLRKLFVAQSRLWATKTFRSPIWIMGDKKFRSPIWSMVVDYGRRKQFVAHVHYRRRRYFVVDNVNFDSAFNVVNNSVSTFEIRKHPTFCHLQRNLFSSPKHTFANVVLSYINNINQNCQRKYDTIYVFILIFTP